MKCFVCRDMQWYYIIVILVLPINSHQCSIRVSGGESLYFMSGQTYTAFCFIRNCGDVYDVYFTADDVALTNESGLFSKVDFITYEFYELVHATAVRCHAQTSVAGYITSRPVILKPLVQEGRCFNDKVK